MRQFRSYVFQLLRLSWISRWWLTLNLEKQRFPFYSSCWKNCHQLSTPCCSFHQSRRTGGRFGSDSGRHRSHCLKNLSHYLISHYQTTISYRHLILSLPLFPDWLQCTDCALSISFAGFEEARIWLRRWRIGATLEFRWYWSPATWLCELIWTSSLSDWACNTCKGMQARCRESTLLDCTRMIGIKTQSAPKHFGILSSQRQASPSCRASAPCCCRRNCSSKMRRTLRSRW